VPPSNARTRSRPNGWHNFFDLLLIGGRWLCHHLSPVTAATQPPILAVEGVEVVYGGAIQVLRGVSLEVPTGSVVAILGANGAGKTTLLRAISGLLLYQNGAITAGHVRFNGDDTTGVDSSALVRNGMAQVMEGRRIFAPLTVDENLKTGAYTRKDKAQIKESYDQVMVLFPRLAERRKQVAGYMSGGEQQMLAIGRALMASPKLLLLDEPSLGLAPIIVEQIFEIVKTINGLGTSVMIVEQNAAKALAVADYAYVLEHDPEIEALYLGGESHDTSYRELKSYRRTREYSA
jgi:branched-chain amino acid transport system ATP-binding protein